MPTILFPVLLECRHVWKDQRWLRSKAKMTKWSNNKNNQTLRYFWLIEKLPIAHTSFLYKGEWKLTKKTWYEVTRQNYHFIKNVFGRSLFDCVVLVQFQLGIHKFTKVYFYSKWAFLLIWKLVAQLTGLIKETALYLSLR